MVRRISSIMVSCLLHRITLLQCFLAYVEMKPVYWILEYNAICAKLLVSDAVDGDGIKVAYNLPVKQSRWDEIDC